MQGQDEPHGAQRLMVIDRLVGIIALKDFLNFLSLRVVLEEPGGNTKPKG
jgi:hypothetical protein